MPHRPSEPLSLSPETFRQLGEQLLERDPAEALQLAQGYLQDGLPAAKIAALLLSGRALYRSGQLLAASEVLEQVSALLSAENLLRVEAGQTLGRVYRDLGEHSKALWVLGEALVTAKGLGEEKAEAETLNLLAGVYAASGEAGQALKHLERALELAKKLQIPVLESNILTNLGRMYRELLDPPRALECLLSSFRIQEGLGADARSRGSNLIELGRAYEDIGDLAQAGEFYRKALELGLEVGDRHLETAALNNLANVHHAQGHLEAARDFFSRALEQARCSGMPSFEVDNLDGLGQVYAAQGELGRARKTFAKGLRAAREVGDQEGELEILLHLSQVLIERQDLDEAQATLQQALGLAAALGRQRLQSQAHERLSRLEEARGQHQAALLHLREAQRLERAAVSEESERRARQMAVQFDLERARSEAQMYRIRTEVEQEARQRAEAEVRQRTAELEASQQEVVDRLALASEYRDDNTGEHIERVGQMAGRIARALGWLEADAQLIATAARLHDVGKIGIPDAILLKPSGLSPSEFAFMREHTTIGGEILSGGQTRLLRVAREIALCHHERWDGQGYPKGLKGQAIPLSARIVAVADALDAMTHERPYKKAWPLEVALEELRRQAGLQFDPEVVQACLEACAGPDQSSFGGD